MKKLLILLIVAGGAAYGVGPSAQAQQSCPPGQSGNAPYCQTLPPACAKFTPKLSLLRASFDTSKRTISILAPISRLASGSVRITLQSAGRTSSFTAPVDAANGRIRATRTITRAQARLGTGILTIAYAGDADTRPQSVRLRAANIAANLNLSRPVITAGGALQASGTVTRRSRGSVRVHLEYVAGGQLETLEYSAKVSNGSWKLDTPLPASARSQIAARCGTVHAYTLFTGTFPQIRGEVRSFQVLPPA